MNVEHFKTTIHTTKNFDDSRQRGCPFLCCGAVSEVRQNCHDKIANKRLPRWTGLLQIVNVESSGSVLLMVTIAAEVLRHFGTLTDEVLTKWTFYKFIYWADTRRSKTNFDITGVMDKSWDPDAKYDSLKRRPAINNPPASLKGNCPEKGSRNQFWSKENGTFFKT